MSDKNEVQILKKETGEVLQRVGCDRFGQSVMFVNACEVRSAVAERLSYTILWRKQAKRGPSIQMREVLGKEEIPPVLEPYAWEPMPNAGLRLATSLRSDNALQYEYLLACDTLDVSAGEYSFEGKIVCEKGGLALLILDAQSEEVIAKLTFDAVNVQQRDYFTLQQPKTVKVILAACNAIRPGSLSAEVRRVSLKQLSSASESFDVLGKEERSPRKGIRRLHEEQLRQVQMELSDGKKRLVGLQVEVNQRDELLGQLQAEMVAEGRRVGQLQAEVIQRDEMLEAYVTQLQALQAEVNRRDQMLVESGTKMEALQAEVNLRDELTGGLTRQISGSGECTLTASGRT